MQFTDALWEDIRKLKLAGVTWELMPTSKIPLNIPKVIVPEVLLLETTIPSQEFVPVIPKVNSKKAKNENPTVPKKRSANKRTKGNAKK